MSAITCVAVRAAPVVSVMVWFAPPSMAISRILLHPVTLNGSTPRPVMLPDKLVHCPPSHSLWFLVPAASVISNSAPTPPIFVMLHGEGSMHQPYPSALYW